MAYRVVLSADAEADLESIVDYIADKVSRQRAEYVLEKISEAFESLSEMPLRGVVVRELAELGDHRFRECFFKPYRIVYTVERRRVEIALIADGRRDMATLLRERLLGP